MPISRAPACRERRIWEPFAIAAEKRQGTGCFQYAASTASCRKNGLRTPWTSPSRSPCARMQGTAGRPVWTAGSGLPANTGSSLRRCQRQKNRKGLREQNSRHSCDARTHDKTHDRTHDRNRQVVPHRKTQDCMKENTFAGRRNRKFVMAEPSGQEQGMGAGTVRMVWTAQAF